MFKFCKLARTLVQTNPLYPPRAYRCFSTSLFRYNINPNWPNEIKTVLETQRIEKLTDIQEKAIPQVSEGKDLVGIARTGSGKTLAFALPAIIRILESRNQKEVDSHHQSVSRPKCLVIVPTRELADQVASVFELFSHCASVICLVGGTNRATQLNNLGRKKFDIFVGTPGRLNDLVSSGFAELSDVKYLVLDEADRLLDMGFEPQIRNLLSTIPQGRQTVMFSATWAPEVQTLAKDFMRDFEKLEIDSGELKANPNIKQEVKVCKPHEKLDELVNYLKSITESTPEGKVLIFVNRKAIADRISLELMRHRMRVVTTHGDKTQLQRNSALGRFKDGSCNTMIATDVAARGLDIKDVTHVVNFDLPLNIEDYIHRIGRTARHNKKGISFTLVTENDNKTVVKQLKIQLQKTENDVPDELEELEFTQASDFLDSVNALSRPGRRFNNYQRNFGGGRQDYYNRQQDGYDGRQGGYGRQRNVSFRQQGSFSRQDNYGRRESYSSGSGRNRNNDFNQKFNDYDFDGHDEDDIDRISPRS